MALLSSKSLGWLALLWIMSRAGRSSAASSAPAAAASTWPKTPLPPYVDPTDAELMTLPNLASAEELRWARYARDPDRPGPRLEIDAGPVTRKLNAFELWALGPYFPVEEDLKAHSIHLGKWPPWVPRDAMPAGGVLGGITDPNTGDVWFPEVRELWSRYWLAVLAHELTHAAQMRMGMTRDQIIQALREHGYVQSPIEVQARAFQRRVLRGLAERARAFYANTDRSAAAVLSKTVVR